MDSNQTCDCGQPEFTCSDIGILLPLINESIWGSGFRTILYLVGLLWSFMAIALVADAFMCAIEVITSQTTEVCLTIKCNFNLLLIFLNNWFGCEGYGKFIMITFNILFHLIPSWWSFIYFLAKNWHFSKIWKKFLLVFGAFWRAKFLKFRTQLKKWSCSILLLPLLTYRSSPKHI